MMEFKADFEIEIRCEECGATLNIRQIKEVIYVTACEDCTRACKREQEEG